MSTVLLLNMFEPPEDHQSRLVGFVVDEAVDARSELIPVTQGISVLYGLNGAGKSRIITDVERFWRGQRSEAVALVQLSANSPDHIDFYRETGSPDWFRDWAQRISSQSGRPEDVLRAWVANSIISEDEAEFPRELNANRDAGVHEEWQQHRLILVRAVGTAEVPEWVSAPAIPTGIGRPHTNAAADVYELLEGDDDLLDFWNVANLAPYAVAPGGGTVMVGCVLGQSVLEFPQDTYTAGRHDQLLRLSPQLDGQVEDLDVATTQFLAAAVPNQVQVVDDEVAASVQMSEAVQDLERLANHHYSRALQDAPELRLSVRVAGLDAGAHWHVEEDDPRAHSERQLRGLSSAQLKWASWAIAEALATLTNDDSTSRLVLFDEPEAALHRSAESQMARYLSELSTTGGLSLLVATHSPELLDMAHARLFEVARLSGKRTVTRLPAIARQSLESLGMLPSDLLRRQRAIILVEGQHDEVVLDSLFGAEFREMRADVIPIRGTHQLAALEMGLLFDFTRAHIVVMLDNVRTTALAETWRSAVIAEQAGDRAAAVAILDGAECLDGSSEGRALRELLQRVVHAGNADRLTPYGLSGADIIEYLPVGVLVPGAESWAQLRGEHAEMRSQNKRAPKDFKAWLRLHRGGDFSPEALKRAVASLDSIPSDFLRLYKTVEARTAQDPRDSAAP